MDEFPVRGDILADEEIRGKDFIGYTTYYDGAITVGVWSDPEIQLPDNFNIEDILKLPSQLEGEQKDPSDPQTFEDLDDDEEPDDFFLDFPANTDEFMIEDLTIDQVPALSRRGAGYVDYEDAYTYIVDGGIDGFAGIIYDRHTGLWYVVVLY